MKNTISMRDLLTSNRTKSIHTSKIYKSDVNPQAIYRLPKLAAYICNLSLKINIPTSSTAPLTLGQRQNKGQECDFHSFLKLEESSLSKFSLSSKNERVALACVLTALEGCPKYDIPQKYRQDMVNAAYWHDHIDCTEEFVHQYRVELRDMFNSHMRKHAGRKQKIMEDQSQMEQRMNRICE
eukprot:CAMPEP_0204625856 /NCGR_PEP_ID=MMETSP0717-20131115/11497_1 /ASSEMBLY_ACC=CAM_ASM_000666 /TAXON_ID=230516 /ORGANISM="Chaetoceros curvisetus" /LENGTH=181 /DNA_ID=CAMNT_0051641643 /DNA_START=180 /DNA_END=725 /DNA_ORIENTATION=-